MQNQVTKIEEQLNSTILVHTAQSNCFSSDTEV